MPDLTIRKSQEEDFERIFEIWLQNQLLATGKTSEYDMGDVFKADLYRVFCLPLSNFYVAETDSNIVIGWQSLTPLFNNPLLSPYISQSSTYVDKEYHRTNMGRALFEYAYAEAKNNGINHIYCWIKPDNHAANRIAESFNYHKYFIPAPNINLPDFSLYVIIVE